METTEEKRKRTGEQVGREGTEKGAREAEGVAVKGAET